jgi:hypothetical protein
MRLAGEGRLTAVKQKAMGEDPGKRVEREGTNYR